MDHIPVMLNEILTSFETFKDRPNLRIFDGTAGRAGHLKEILAKFPAARSEAWDQDPEAIAAIEKMKIPNLELYHRSFHEFDPETSLKFDIMLLDLGVSSPQLDQGHRGFSFYADGPLDMRMNNSKGRTAAEVINSATEQELFHIFGQVGEVRRPLRVVRAILNRRTTKAFTTTGELSGLIESTDGWRKRGSHPATNYFMGLRIVVNDELEGLRLALPKIRAGLKPGGRLAVLTFHSLEDRIVKQEFKGAEDGYQVNKKVIVPSREEQVKNPRSRSAKLRVFESQAEILD